MGCGVWYGDGCSDLGFERGVSEIWDGVHG